MTASTSLWAEVGAIGGLSILVAWVPRRLVAAVTDATPGRQGSWALGLLCTLTASLTWLAVRDIRLAIVMLLSTAVIVYDFRYLIIPDLLSLALALCGLWQGIGSTDPWLNNALEAGLGALVCGGLLGLVAWAWRRQKGSEGLGFGDIKLAAAYGLMLGPIAGAQMVAGAALSGAVFGLVQRARPGSDLIPFGVFLAAVSMGLLLWAGR